MKFHQVEFIFNKYLHLVNNRDFLPAALGTVVANRLDALPVWTIFMGKASSSKSEVLSAFDDSLEVHTVSKITDKSLASNINMSAREMKGKEEPSLLDKIDGKNLIIRDASSLISIPKDKRRIIFSDLRAAYDGKFESSSGISQKDFKAKFGMLIAATEALERLRTMEAELGERFLTFRLNPEDERLVWTRIYENSVIGESFVKEELGNAAVRFLNTCPTPEKVEFPSDVAILANAIAHCRTHIHRDRGDKHILEVVEISEAPFRVGKQLAAYYTGIKAVTESHGRAMNIIRKVTRDSIRPVLRAQVIKAILNGQDTAQKITAYLGVSGSPIDRTIQDLGLIGVLNKSRGKDKRERVLSIKKGFDVPFKAIFGG